MINRREIADGSSSVSGKKATFRSKNGDRMAQLSRFDRALNILKVGTEEGERTTFEILPVSASESTSQILFLSYYIDHNMSSVSVSSF